MVERDKRVAIGVDLGGTSVKYALGTDRGEIIKEDERPSYAHEDSSKILDNISEAIIEMQEYALSIGLNPLAVGMGTPGSVDVHRGILMGSTPNFRCWNEVPVAAELKKRINLSVYVDNDANLMALGEAKYGSGIGHDNVICVTIGTGVGGGIIINKQLYRGAFCAGAELGHSTIIADGLPCKCGGDGCLEKYTSATAMIRIFKELHDKNNLNLAKEEIDVKYIFNQLKEKNPIAERTVNECSYYLGRGLASFINIFNPNIIIIGGGVAQAGAVYIDKVREATIKYAMKKTAENVKIVAASLGNKAGFLGAIFYALDCSQQIN